MQIMITIFNLFASVRKQNIDSNELLMGRVLAVTIIGQIEITRITFLI